MLENKKLLIGIGAGLFVFILIIVIVVAVAPKKKKKVTNTNETTATEVTTVTMWTPLNDEAAYKVFKNQLNNKGIVLSVVKKDPNTYLQDVVEAVAAGGGPDIMYMQNDWMPKYNALLKPEAVEKSQYSDTTKDFKEKYPKFVSEEMLSSDGSVYGYPMSADPLVMYVNQKLFADLRAQMLKSKAGIDTQTDQLLRNYPTTWDDFRTASRMLTIKNGTEVTQAGTALGTDTNIDNAENILYALMIQNGTQFISADLKTATFNLQQKNQRGEDVYPGTNALQFMTSFADPNSDVYTWNENMPNATDYFVQGKMAMLIAHASKGAYIQQQNPILNFKAMTLPQIRQTLTPTDYTQYWALSVNKNSKNTDIAWKAVKFLAGDNPRNLYVSNTRRNPIANSDLGSAKANTIKGLIKLSGRVYKPDPERVDSLFLGMIHNVTHNKQPLQYSVDEAARDVTELLK